MIKTKQTAEDLLKLSDAMYSQRGNVLSLWQTLADHFYPERADFTIARTIGDETCDRLMDSYPVIARRDLANSYGAMLRDGKWFDMTTAQEIDDGDAKAWKQWGTDRLYSLMQDRASGFTRATKEGDHDYATFGQCALSVEVNRNMNGLLYRCWHLRDMAWFDDASGNVSGVSRKWNATYRDLITTFGSACHPKILDGNDKTPFANTEVRHIVLPVDMYHDEGFAKFRFVSIFVDVANRCIIEERGMDNKYYVIPRFQTVAGSPYAISPATMAALPNARLLQSMTFTLMEASERVTRPPMIAKSNVITGGAIDLSANGITFIDAEFDERLGEGLRPLMTNVGGIPIGMEMRDRIVGILSSAFYLNKITLPESTREMTAYEVQERMKQYRRENLPLFAPMEADYNGQLCETSFEIAMRAGLLGSPYDVPESLRGQEVVFKFKSPLSSTEEDRKLQTLRQALQTIGEIAPFDEQIVDNVNFDTAFREALGGIGVPEKWFYSVKQMTGMRQAESAMMAQQQAVAG